MKIGDRVKSKWTGRVGEVLDVDEMPTLTVKHWVLVRWDESIVPQFGRLGWCDSEQLEVV